MDKLKVQIKTSNEVWVDALGYDDQSLIHLDLFLSRLANGTVYRLVKDGCWESSEKTIKHAKEP